MLRVASVARTSMMEKRPWCASAGVKACWKGARVCSRVGPAGISMAEALDVDGDERRLVLVEVAQAGAEVEGVGGDECFAGGGADAQAFSADGDEDGGDGDADMIELDGLVGAFFEGADDAGADEGFGVAAGVDESEGDEEDEGGGDRRRGCVRACALEEAAVVRSRSMLAGPVGMRRGVSLRC